jgi:hypothetical protein
MFFDDCINIALLIDSQNRMRDVTGQVYQDAPPLHLSSILTSQACQMCDLHGILKLVT